MILCARGGSVRPTGGACGGLMRSCIAASPDSGIVRGERTDAWAGWLGWRGPWKMVGIVARDGWTNWTGAWLGMVAAGDGHLNERTVVNCWYILWVTVTGANGIPVEGVLLLNKRATLKNKVVNAVDKGARFVLLGETTVGVRESGE